MLNSCHIHTPLDGMMKIKPNIVLNTQKSVIYSINTHFYVKISHKHTMHVIALLIYFAPPFDTSDEWEFGSNGYITIDAEIHLTITRYGLMFMYSALFFFLPYESLNLVKANEDDVCASVRRLQTVQNQIFQIMEIKHLFKSAFGRSFFSMASEADS